MPFALLLLVIAICDFYLSVTTFNQFCCVFRCADVVGEQDVHLHAAVVPVQQKAVRGRRQKRGLCVVVVGELAVVVCLCFVVLLFLVVFGVCFWRFVASARLP